jgi:hypothetical protein
MFVVAIARTRHVGRAPDAIFDDRFATQPRDAGKLVHVRGTDAAVAPLADAGIELAVQLLAHWLLGARGVYR